MAPAPRSPRPPRAPSAPVSPPLPRLRLQRPRTRESVDLDGERTRTGLELPPFVRWDQFWRDWDWRQGEHVTTVGPTGSGKTVLNRQLLRRRDFVVVLGVKNRDPELYGPFEKQGYELVRRFDPEPPMNQDSHRVLFVPTTDKHGTEGRQARSKRFRQALNDIYDVGRWTVYCDDVQYMADQLRLAPELEELWMIGRSERVSVVASSQEPVNIPLMAYSGATHLFLAKNPDKRRAERMGELTGVNREQATYAILRLPDHEFLYIDKRSGEMIRTKVENPRR